MKRGKESKPHIGIYGCCNAGKSTLMNLLVGESCVIVSPEGGTTTDPIRRSFEILDFAPVVAIDTAGVDDTTLLGEQRMAKALETLHHIDLAIIVFRDSWGSEEDKLLSLVKNEGLDCIIIHNLFGSVKIGGYLESDFSLTERDRLLEAIKDALPEHSYKHYSMLGGRCGENDVALLICPIDSEAPAGRLILPQVQAIRDILDSRAIAVTLQPDQISAFLSLGIDPKVIVTDSQVIDVVKKSLPEVLHSRLTTFSILLAELKGDVEEYKKGLKKAMSLKHGDKVLIMENCLHQSSCEDIGRVKIPLWLNQWRGCELDYTVISGLSPLPENLEEYALVVQCGGCMVTPRQLKSRIRRIVLRGVAITNYGMLIKLLLSGEN